MADFECLDQFLNSPSSSDNDLKQRMPWLCHNEDQNSSSYSTSAIGSSFELAQDASSDFLISDSDYKMGLNPCEDQRLGCQFDTNVFVPSSSLVTYPEMGSSQSVFQSFQNVPPPSHIPPFEGVSSISHHGLGQNGTGGFDFEDGLCIEYPSNFPASLSSKDLRNYPLPATMTSKSNGLQSMSQIRREKIADRMKNLQELLPNLNKTDKASTLDEIIEYVKFLQLQVKGSEGSLVPPSSGKLKSDVAFGWDGIAFERELVKLMDSNVSSAMEFLQTKGLSLMPLSLASAISPPSGSHRPASDGNDDDVMVKPDQAENNIPFIPTEPKPKS